jgi:predicted RNA-binding protein with PIN domain
VSLLIDGYNLLNAVGVMPPHDRPAGLEQSRRALLDFLADKLEPREVSRTIVVFDAAGAPPGLPRQVTYRGLLIRFAPRTTDADTLLEELIQADTAPRRLTVVSSDHRVQRAAKRRRARAVDSDVWFLETLRRHRSHPEPHGPTSAPPLNPFPPGYGEDLLAAERDDVWELPPLAGPDCTR